MTLTVVENRQFRMYLKRYQNDARVLEMKRYKQHGTVSTYDHCWNVARLSFWISRRFGIRVDEKALITGAFLHDFYLYDWHIPEDSHRFHGFCHANAARENAVMYFQVNEKEQSIIESHMWPLTITCVPQNREAVIVCIADKVCSVIETLWQRKKSFEICG